MENKQQQPMDYERPSVPPGTPPTIDRNADAQAAAELAQAGGDSDQLGETPQEAPEQPIMPSEAPPPD